MAGKVAVVFGGARNIGKEYARALLEDGGKVVIADVLAAEGKNTEQEFLQRFPDRVHFVPCDVTKDSDVKNVFEKALEFGSGVQICVSSVGVCRETDWQLTMQVNYGGTVRVTYTAMEYMSTAKGHDGGIIVHTSSVNAFRRNPFIPVYTGTKAAIVAFARSLGTPEHYEQSGVKVHVICPCLVMTDFQKEVDVLMPEQFQKAESDQPEITCADCATALRRLLAGEEENGAVLVVSAMHGTFVHSVKTESYYNDVW